MKTKKDETAKTNEVTADAAKTNEVTADAGTETTPAPVAKVEIIRGRMPLPIVAMIKNEDKALTDGALATKYRTTNGKISDIRKERNFGYVTDLYVPTADEVEKSKAWAELHGGEDIKKAVEALKAGSDEDRAKYDAFKAEFNTKAKAAKANAAPAEPAEPAPAEPVAEPEKTEDPKGDAPKTSGKKDPKISDEDLNELTA